jgi:hypothetical protein
LIGTKTGNTPIANWTPLLEHFHENFHTGTGGCDYELAEDVGGVYYKYLSIVPPGLAQYDDVFLVEVRVGTANVRFGIALLVDEALDVSGIRVLKSTEIVSLLSTFRQEWQNADPNFCFAD